MHGIDLVFYGENEAEYGNPIADNASSLRDKSYHTMEKFEDMYIAGMPVQQIIEEHGVSLSDLMTFLPLPAEEFTKTDIQIHYLGYYLKWIPQEAYYLLLKIQAFRHDRSELRGHIVSTTALMTRLMIYSFIHCLSSMVWDGPVMRHHKRYEIST